MSRRKVGKVDGEFDDHDEDDEEDVHVAVAIARADSDSRFYDPRYARPIQSGSAGGWGEFDPAILDDGRPAVPAFPLEVLPAFWRAWARDTAQAAGAPVDYVALSLIAAVAGLCGVGVRVQPAPGWQEPLVLWQALVGAASSGKSPAIASLRRLLATLAWERAGAAADSESPSDPSSDAAPVAAGAPPMGLADVAASDARGALLWCDEPADWLARLDGASSAARTQLVRAWSPLLTPSVSDAAAAPLAASLLVCLPPERVPQMAKMGVELCARFLFTWPHPPPYSPLAGRKAADDGAALAALGRLLSMAGTTEVPRLLTLDDKALPPLDSFLARLHGELAESGGLDHAWQGKGRGTVVRLIGCLALLDASVDPSGLAPDVIGRSAVERAIALWRDYLRPHARAVLQGGLPDDMEDKARHVVRWLRARGISSFSREEIRCEALRRSLDAARTEQLLYRLSAAGIVKRVHYSIPQHGGRPPNRWEVNPRLIAAGNVAAGNAGNPGNLQSPANTPSPG